MQSYKLFIRQPPWANGRLRKIAASGVQRHLHMAEGGNRSLHIFVEAHPKPETPLFRNQRKRGRYGIMHVSDLILERFPASSSSELTDPTYQFTPMITHKTVHRHHNYLSQLWPDTVWRNQRGNATYVLLHTYRKRGRNKSTTYILLHTCRTHDRNKREHQTCIATYCVKPFVDFYELGARSSSNVGRNLAPPNQEVSGKARINPTPIATDPMPTKPSAHRIAHPTSCTAWSV